MAEIVSLRSPVEEVLRYACIDPRSATLHQRVRAAELLREWNGSVGVAATLLGIGEGSFPKWPKKERKV